ncbi:aKG-HExxH-type peptide beta-hydroxylase [Streptomyces sp. NPDC097617]|uniref:aKG-HExxH-type peptide beta-hydroxylase n=1 Tax=Streptomyces sp. NPDC097617 TaxID=3366091 RepID=UPI003825CA17
MPDDLPAGHCPTTSPSSLTRHHTRGPDQPESRWRSFHECGHALHALLSDVTYPSFTAPGVPRDFSEAPAQVHEGWAWHTLTADQGPGEPSEIESRTAAAHALDTLPQIPPRYRSAYFGHFVAVPYLMGPGKGAEVELRLPEPGTELWLPGHAFHLLFASPVERVVIADLGDGTVRDGVLRLPVAFFDGSGPDNIGEATRAGHLVIGGTAIEIDGEHPWIARHFASMNSHEPQPGYPSSDLTVRAANHEDGALVDAAFSLIDECWPELAAEIRAYVRLFVPYGSAFHSSFTETCLMGAIFLSEAAQPFTSREYTAEHLLHEAAHLRLMLILELDPLVTCRDEAVFNSPVRKDPRPLWGMLQAIFVFARITAFHRRAHAVTGVQFHQDAQRDNARLLAEGMDEIEAEPSTSFTPAGVLLWQQMRSEIAAAS